MMSGGTEDVRVQASHLRLVRRLLLTVVAMFAFGYALVPLYEVFCEVAGLNGRTGVVDAQDVGDAVDVGRTVTVELLGTAQSDLPWEFRPVVKRVRVHPGEVQEVRYLAENLSTGTVVGRAVPSVSPSTAARYFNKTECFCFTRQSLGPGEEREMPVRFVIGTGLPDGISTVTLSYTFFNVTGRG